MSDLPLLTPFHRASLALTLAARAYRTPVAFGTNGILEQRDGRILLVRHRYMPGLCFPGGGINSGEAPADAILRELKEELGTTRVGALKLFGLYTRKVGWTTNVIALYRVADAEIDFRPGLEISEIVYADPRDPPADTTPAVRRRLAEFVGTAEITGHW